MVWRAIWQLLDGILLALWWLGIGLLVREDLPGLSRLSLALAAAAVVGVARTSCRSILLGMSCWASHSCSGRRGGSGSWCCSCVLGQVRSRFRHSGRQSNDLPAITYPSIQQPVMHSAGLTLPELDALRANPVATPVLRAGHVRSRKTPHQPGGTTRSARRESLRSTATTPRRRAENRARAAREVCLGFRTGHRSARPSTRTCRCNGYQPKSSATYEDPAISDALRDA